MKDLIPTLVDAATPLIKLLVALAFAWLTVAIKRWLAAGTARDVALELSTSAEVVVRSLEQTLRPVVAEAMDDGKLTKDEADVLRRTALADLREQLSAQATKHIEANSERLNDVLTRAIEAAVQKTKAESVRPPAPPAKDTES